MEMLLENMPLVAGAGVLALFVLLLYLTPSARSWEKEYEKKSAVLENASVFVHSIEPIEAPDVPSAHEEVERQYYVVDVTITPATAAMPGARATGPALWDPCQLDTTDPDSDPQAIEEPCELSSVEVRRGGRFVAEDDLPDQEKEVEGPQRVRLLVGAYPTARRFVLLYHLREIGEVRLP